MLGLCLLALQLLLILVQEEGAVRGHRGQWLEDVRHGTEAVLGGGLGVLRQDALLWADGTELEVFTVHGDIGCQGLQVQLIEIRLRKDTAKTKKWRGCHHLMKNYSCPAPHPSQPLPESLISDAALTVSFPCSNNSVGSLLPTRRKLSLIHLVRKVI